ncbi:MAG TPA: aminotransferase DegT, partial [Myxococcaceae bacterium]|nr:aminotransferase DegT [Myxococcaceae bacterium]
AVFCLYKTLPVPNGGVLVHNRAPLPALESLSLRSCGMAPLAGRSAELVLEWLRGRCNGPTQALFGLKRAAGRALRAAGVEPVPVGDMGFELSQVDVGISPMCEVLMRRWDCGAIRDRRRANFRHLRARLAGRVTPLLEDLPEGVCPLFFPILVGDKRGAARALRARGVEAIEFWNEGDAGARDFADTRFLRKHVLELPIHQDLSPEQIDYVADRVGELRPGLPC